VALVVNGEKIDDSRIQREVERLRPDYEKVFRDQDDKEKGAQLFDWSRENVIERVLVSQRAKRYGEQIPKGEVEAAFEEMKKQCGGGEQLKEEFGIGDEKEIKEQIELRMRAERMLQDVCKDLPEPSEDAVQQYYEGNKGRFGVAFGVAEQVRVAHIVKHINWQADEATAYNVMREAQNELRNGAVFEMLVAKYSDCTDNGGDLGYITRGQMVEEFEDVVFNLGVGDTSDVFRTRFGFHIAKLYERKPATVGSFKEVRGQIADELKSQIRAKAIDEFIDHLKSEAKIEEV
jgi:parvulin-like peptidyl-prolyl isomerase